MAIVRTQKLLYIPPYHTISQTHHYTSGASDEHLLTTTKYKRISNNNKLSYTNYIKNNNNNINIYLPQLNGISSNKWSHNNNINKNKNNNNIHEPNSCSCSCMLHSRGHSVLLRWAGGWLGGRLGMLRI